MSDEHYVRNPVTGQIVKRSTFERWRRQAEARVSEIESRPADYRSPRQVEKARRIRRRQNRRVREKMKYGN